MPECIVCGRFFHEGQGIVIKMPGGVLEFHSSRCAQKFLRRLIDEAETDCVSSEAIKLARKLKREAGERLGLRKKVI